jgi:hypothetical protein
VPWFCLASVIGWGIEPLEEPMEGRDHHDEGHQLREPIPQQRDRGEHVWLAHEISHEAPVTDEHESTGVETRKLGMWVFLSSEFLFFGALITNYLLYSNRRWFEGTYPAEIYDIPFTSVSSFVLLMSSLTMVLAHNALSRGDQNGTRTWLFATAALGRCSSVARSSSSPSSSCSTT